MFVECLRTPSFCRMQRAVDMLLNPLRHIFFNLDIDAREHPVLLTEPPLNPAANREKLVMTMLLGNAEQLLFDAVTVFL